MSVANLVYGGSVSAEPNHLTPVREPEPWLEGACPVAVQPGGAAAPERNRDAPRSCCRQPDGRLAVGQRVLRDVCPVGDLKGDELAGVPVGDRIGVDRDDVRVGFRGRTEGDARDKGQEQDGAQAAHVGAWSRLRR